MKKNIGITILIISIILTMLLVSNKKEADTIITEIDIPLVKVRPLIQNTINATIQSQGTIFPANEIIILSEINARVAWVSEKLDNGASFNKGDTLVKLDSRDYELALISAESNILNAKVNLEREQAEFDLANKEWERVGSGKASDLTLRKPQLAQAEAIWAASKAASISSSDDIVSIHKKSTPPALRARLCFKKASLAFSFDKSPSGSIISPVGPIDPAIKTSLVDFSIDFLAI